MIHRHRSRLVATLGAIALAVAVLAGSAPTLAADADDAQIESDVKAIAKLFKQLKVKGEPIVIVDGAGDLIDAGTGQPADGPGHGDPRVVAYVVTDAGKAQAKQVDKRIQADNTDAIIGNQAKVAPGRWLVVVAITDGPKKGKVPDGVQGLLGLGGPQAVPLFVNSALDSLAGNQTVVLFGKFPDLKQLLTGTTSLVGVAPGGRPPWNEAEATAFGFRQGNTWLIIVPLDDEVPSFDLVFQSLAGDRQLLDPVTSHYRVDRFPADGSALADGFCSSGRTYATKDAADMLTGHQIEFAVKTEGPTDQSAFEGFSVTTGGDDPQDVPGGFQFFPGPGGSSLAIGNFVAPPVNDVVISFTSSPTPGNAPSLNPTNLRDGSTIHLGTESGTLFGGPCGLLPAVPDGLGPAAVNALLQAFGFDPSAFEHVEFSGEDGSDNRIIFDPAVGQPAIVVGTDRRPSTEDDRRRRVVASFCDVSTVDRGLGGTFEQCPDGTQRLFWLEPFVLDGVEQEFGRTWFFEAQPGGFPGGQFPAGVILALDQTLSPGLDAAIDGVVDPYQRWPYDDPPS